MSEASSTASEIDMLGLIEVEEFRRNRRPNRLRRYRQRINYSATLDEFEFRMRFRLNKTSVEFLLTRIGQRLNRSTRNHGISNLHKLLLALRFYALGSMLITVGDFIGVSTSSACRIVNNVSRTIVDVLFAETVAIFTNASRGFYEVAAFPHVIGVIDGTHVEIQSPGGIDAEEYRNRKGYFSINVQGVCDSRLKFVDMVARWPGSAHDATIFHHSVLKIRFENGEFGNQWLLGDSAYPAKSYMMTPLSNPENPQEVLYNEALVRTRNIIERCYGVWKRRFPVVGLKMRLSLSRVVLVVYATAILHNLAIDKNIDLPPPEVEVRPQPPVRQRSVRPVRENATRQDLIDNYFASLIRADRRLR